MVADDDMVDEPDPDESCGLLQLTRELDILLRRCRISARVIVHHDEAGGMNAECFDEDFP